MKEVSLEDNNYVFNCPHCDMYVQVPINQVNCKIFRHAVYKKNFIPINPHMSKYECDRLLNTHQIYGCTGPFKLTFVSDKIYAEICDYI